MPDLNNIPLKGLRTVSEVAHHGSLSRAAQAMNVSIGAVSQQVSRTEKALGVPLFIRQRDGMVPTDEAREFIEALARGFGQIARGLDRLSHRRDNIVTITVAPIFATRWLVWRLQDFYKTHPDIKVRIDLDTSLVDPSQADVDFGIRVGSGHWPDVKVEKLFDLLVVPVCSQQMAEQLQSPADLAHVPIIREPRPMFGWNSWLAPEGLDESILGDGPELPDAAMCLDAAISGMGVFLAFEVLAREGLAHGPLATPFPRYHDTGLSYALITAPDRALGAPQQAFRRWLKATLKAERMGDPSTLG